MRDPRIPVPVAVPEESSATGSTHATQLTEILSRAVAYEESSVLWADCCRRLTGNPSSCCRRVVTGSMRELVSRGGIESDNVER